MRPKDYKVQDGCHNCVLCFEPWNPESWEGCCSFRIGHSRLQQLYTEYMESIWTPKVCRKYTNYLFKNMVRPEGLCKHWKNSVEREEG